MEITVTIPDEIVAEAQARGLSTESYVAELIAGPGTISRPAKTRDQRRAQIEQFVEEISRNSENIPLLPDEAFTRESFYSDHD